MNQKNIETIIKENGITDFKFISGNDVIVSQWPRFKCIYGCDSNGLKGSCPPAVPSVTECREFFTEYRNIAVLHFQKKLENPEERKAWSKKINAGLLKLEREIFLAGYHKAFLLFMDECRLCEECPGTREECLKPHLSRPCPEGLGVDVFGTARKIGFPIEVLNNFDQTMNRYAFILID